MMNLRFLFILIILIGGVGFSGCARIRAIIRSDRDDKEATYYYLLSELDVKKNNLPSAIENLDKSLRKDPEQSYLWYKKAAVEASMGDLKKAENDVEKSLVLSPRNSDALILQGKLFQTQEKWENAVSAYQKALQVKPDSDETNVLLIEAFVAQKNFQAALAQIRSWEKRLPEEVVPLFYEASLYQNILKNQVQAIDAYRQILGIEPDNMKALSALADIYIERKENRKVLDVFRQMEAVSPTDVSIKIKIALIYYEHKEYDKAIEKFRELLKIHGEEDRITYYMGVIYENLKRDQEALLQFGKVPSRSNFYKDACLHIAFLNRRGKNDVEAIRVLDEAIRQRPEIGTYYEYLSEIYKDKREHEKAIDILKKGISRSPEKEPLYYALGMAYDAVGRMEEAISVMRKVLRINSKNAGAMNYIGYTYAVLETHLDEAEDWVQKALALKPDDGYITDSLGWVYFKKGDLEKALSIILKAYRMVPNEPTIAEHLGDIYLKRNDPQKALKYYEESLIYFRKKDESANPQDAERVKGKIEQISHQ